MNRLQAGAGPKGSTYAEIAAEMGCCTHTARNRVVKMIELGLARHVGYRRVGRNNLMVFERLKK